MSLPRRLAPRLAPAGALVILALALALEGSAAAQARPFIGGELDQDTILQRITVGYPREMRQVGTSSVTLRVELGRIRVAYKPRTDSHPRGYLAEIAAYRIARHLELDNVPPVIGLRMPRLVMQHAFTSEHEGDWEPIRQDIRWDTPGVTRGAAIYWIPSMRASELATPAGIDENSTWLRVDGDLPPEREALARDLSTLFAFDYVIGNWDRLSGGNISTTADGDRLFIRDHNVAFGWPLADGPYTRIRGNLERVQRFSRSVIAQIASLDESTLREALGEDPLAPDVDILSPIQIEGVLERSRALLSYVGALIAIYGVERVLPWP